LCELVWVSQDCYHASKAELLVLLNRILLTKQIVVQEPEVVWKAWRLFQAGKADFADYLIGQVALAHGCKHTATFDKAAAKAGMTLLA